MRISLSEFVHLSLALVAAAQTCSQEQKPVVLLQTSTANGRLHSGGRASSAAGLSQVGPHAAATSALAFAERLFSQDRSLLQRQAIDVDAESAVGNNVIVPVIIAVSAALLSCGIVVCLITYQPKPEYTQEEESRLRTNMDAHGRYMREKQTCAC